MGITDDLFGPQDPPVGQDDVHPAGKDDVTENEQLNGMDVDGTMEQASAEAEIPLKKTPYSPEELTAAIINDDEIDTSRLSLEGQALMKAIQRGLTPKLERASQMEREFKQKITEMEAPKKDKTIEDYFDENPEGLIIRIDRYISGKQNEARQHRSSGDYENADAVRDEIEDFMNLKANLLANRFMKITGEIKKEKEERHKLSMFPDLKQKREMARTYMADVMQLPQERVADLLEDDKMVKHFAGLLEKSTAAGSAKDKISKKPPDPLGRPGSSSEMRKPRPGNMDDLMLKAKKSGNFQDVFKAIGWL